MTETTAQKQSNTQLPKVGYSKREAAQMLGICEKSVERLVQRGLLKPSRALRTPIFSLKEMERFLAETADTPDPI